MDTKEIFEITGRLGNEITRLRIELENVNLGCLKMMDTCPHEIVFKYCDNHPRKAIIDGSYFCPACGRTITCYYPEQLLETEFKQSRVIPIMNLSLVASKKLYYTIRTEVYSNLDLYYNLSTSVDELTSRMESLLKEQENRYESPTLELRKKK